MAWSIWQTLRAREKAKAPVPGSPPPPTLDILLEIFSAPLPAAQNKESTPQERPHGLRKEA
jgi:hypothetical protein